MAFDPTRLFSQLQNTGLANKDNPLFQLLSQMIKALGIISNTVNAGGGTGGGGGGSTTIENLVQFLDPGTITFKTEQFLLQARFLKLSGADRLTIQGTTRIYLEDFGYTATPLIVGQPRWFTVPFTILSDTYLLQFGELILTNNVRATLKGNAQLIMSDDFGTRSRINLVGAN